MTREELKEIVIRIIRKTEEQAEDAPETACIFHDNPCDVTTYYATNEEG